MARKPARLERAGALTPRDRMWAAVRAMHGILPAGVKLWSPVEIHFLVNYRVPPEKQVHVDTVLSYLEGLTKATPPYVQLLEGDRPAGRKRSELALYFLVRDVGVDAPRVNRHGEPVTEGIGNDRMWAAMKALKDFDHAELAAAATDRAHVVSEETAKSYCTSLCRARYLTLVAAAVHGHTKARYRFNRSKNTGPRAPLIGRDKSVMDANTGQIVFEPGKGGQECPDRT